MFAVHSTWSHQTMQNSQANSEGVSLFHEKHADPVFLRAAETLQRRACDFHTKFSAAWSGRLFRPLIFDAKAYSGLFTRLDALATLIESLPARFFNGDICALGEALGMEAAPLNVLRRLGRRSSVRAFRADIVLHDRGASVIELNWGSRLGGYDIDGLASAVIAAFKASTPSGDPLDVFPAPTDALVSAIHEYLPDGIALAATQVVLVCGGEVDRESPMMQSIAAHLSQYLPDVRLISLDELPRFIEAIPDVSFPVVLRYFQVDDIVGDERLISAVASLYDLDEQRRLLLWTGLEGAVFASKGLLSLLYELASSDRLADHEKSVVLDLVAPSWDARALASSWPVASEQIGLPIGSVLFKPKRGLGGGGIVLGRDVSPADSGDFWNFAQQNDLVVQRLLEPIPVAYAPPGGADMDWRVVLGAYLTPIGPGGVVVRARPWQDGSAVVSASGSTVSRVGTLLAIRGPQPIP